MAKPGYGKRTAPDQRPRTPHDFSLLPARERYVAAFVDHLPDGAAMSVKQLAKQLPLYGQQAISTALTALSVAGHLRRVRCAVGAGDETRWVFRTFWSRTAHDNEWWNTYLTTENTLQTTSPAPDTAPPPPWVPDEEPPPPAPEGPGTEQGPEPTAVPQQRTPAQAADAEPEPPAPDTAPAPHPSETGPSPAYLALARLGREDRRLPLSADDCTALEPLAAQWLARGVSVDYLTSALTAGLPTQVDSPLGFTRKRLTDKMPPHLPTTPSTPPGTPTSTPTRRILMECTDCGRPGQPEALPDGLCHTCRTTHHPHTDKAPTPPVEAAAIKTHMTNLRDLLKTV
ncbi:MULTISPECIES: MarR family transcriptional regulator [unclassified Streptomyces]|uniref:MarR family transcriptional regulator n=1 Tax=unclassified Streptomyces TaxID=2593676 RepID=UPI000B8214E4|nr:MULTISPECIES: MarR family transcriptional regulator [unclassified Streptomyces]MYR98120.1 MarR family transcriptional regulator [Streptomyces sp. SID4937]